ncbi:hypothetical protein DER46DRAFT_613811 [Fusarium sp. MPI-SDFR-AT-0072]|nr:hypothetical protein DER46DRAFT_613811 [Fusarium sp. MPI-SDFR-AT-0072]
MTGPTTSVQPRLGLPLVVNVLDCSVGFALECMLIIIVDTPKKMHRGLMLAIRLVTLLTPTSRLLVIILVNDPANLELSPTMTPMVYLLGSDPAPPRDQLTCLSGSLLNIASLLLIIYLPMHYTAIFLYLLYLSYNI